MTDKILIPLLCYNYSKFLPECLESILRQTHKNWKVVVRDPGSTDNTKKLMSYYTKKDSRINYIREKCQFSQGGSRNKTINENPDFHIIAYHDVDDIMMPDRLEQSIKALSDSHIVYGNARKFGQKHYFYKPFPYVNYKLLYHGNMICGGTVCFRRNVWVNVGGFYEKEDIYEDYEFWLRAAKAGFKFKYLNQILVLNRFHSKSIMHKVRSNQIEKKYPTEHKTIKKITLRLLSKAWQMYVLLTHLNF